MNDRQDDNDLERLHGRFQRRYRERERRGRRRLIARLAIIVTGILVTIGGLLMLVLPGPGIVVTILGLGMLAGEWLFVARFLDRGERVIVPKVTTGLRRVRRSGSGDSTGQSSGNRTDTRR